MTTEETNLEATPEAAPDTTPVAPVTVPAPERTSDAEQQAFLAERYNQDITPVSPEATAGATPIATDDAPVDWLTDEIKAEAKAYGFDDDELEAFGNAAQLSAAMRVDNKKLREQGATYLRGQQPTAEPTAQGDAATARSAAQPSATPSANPQSALGATGDPLAAFDAILADLKNPEHGYDDKLVAAIETQRAIAAAQQQQLQQAMGWIQQQEQVRQQQMHAMEAEQFARDVAAMGLSDLFGADFNSATPAQKQAWQQAYDAFMEIKYGIGLRDGQLPQYDSKLAKRAVHSAFPDQLKKLAKAEVAKSVRQSAAKRMGGSLRTAPVGPHNGPTSSDPVLRDAWDKLVSDPSARLR